MFPFSFRLAAVAVVALSLAACGAEEALAPESPAAPLDAPDAPDAAIGALVTQGIAFASYRLNNHPDIYLTDPAGTSVTRLTSFSGDEASPAQSWNHKRLAFVRRRVDAQNVGRDDIYLMNTDGSGKHWARSSTSTFHITNPSWSPDGTHLVVTVTLQGTPYLATMDVATGTMDFVRGWNAPIEGYQGSYSPDGKSVIFVQPSGKAIGRVWFNADDVILVSPGVPVAHPTFSPDGKWLAYERLIAGTNNMEVYARNVATGSNKRLTYNSRYDGQPSWSPDGSKIAFTSNRSGQFQLYTMPASGGSPTRITHTSTSESSPSWSH